MEKKKYKKKVYKLIFSKCESLLLTHVVNLFYSLLNVNTMYISGPQPF